MIRFYTLIISFGNLNHNNKNKYVKIDYLVTKNKEEKILSAKFSVLDSNN